MSNPMTPAGAPQRQRIAMPTSLFGDGGVLSAEARGELHMPQFDGSYSVFRVLPAPHLNVPGQVEPWRIDRTQFGQWFLPLYVVKSVGMGDNRETWVVHDPKDPNSFNTRTNPVMRMRQYVQNAIKQRLDRGWAGLLQGAPGKGAELPPVDLRALVRVYMPFHKKKAHQPMLGKPEHPGQLAYLLLAQGAWTKMSKLMDEPADGVRTDSSNPCLGYKIGDPIDPAQGVWWIVYKDGHDPRQQNAQTFQQPGQPHNPYGPPPQAEKEDFRGFGVHYEFGWHGQSAAIPPDEMGRLLSMMPHLDSCVSVVDERTQVTRLIKLFRPVIDLVYQVFNDEYSDLFSDADRAEALHRLGKSPMVSVGALPPAPGFGYHPPVAYPSQPQYPGAPAGFPQPTGYPAQPAPAYVPQAYQAPQYPPTAAAPAGFPAPAAYPPAGAAQAHYPVQPPPVEYAPQTSPVDHAAAGYGGYGAGDGYGAVPQVAPTYTPPFPGDPFVGQQLGQVDPAAMAAAQGPAASAYPSAPGQPPAAYPAATPQTVPGLSPEQASNAIEAAKRAMQQRAAAQQQRPPQG